MKKSLLVLIFSVFLFSCQKQKYASIVGGWVEISSYAERSGQNSWGPAARFPLKLSFREDGKYYAFNDVPAGNGNYFYEPKNKVLQIETLNPVNTSIYTVSFLTDDYLIIEYSTDYKLKFVRL